METQVSKNKISKQAVEAHTIPSKSAPILEDIPAFSNWFLVMTETAVIHAAPVIQNKQAMKTKKVTTSFIASQHGAMTDPTKETPEKINDTSKSGKENLDK